MFNAEKVCYWGPSTPSSPDAIASSASGKGFGSDSSSDEGLPLCKATLCCLVSPDISGAEVSQDEGLVGACFSTGAVVHAADAGADPRRETQFDKQMNVVARSVVCVPLLESTTGKAFGVLHVINKKAAPGREEVSQ